MEENLTFGKWLASKRKEARLSQPKLAAKAGISVNYVAALELEIPNRKDGRPRQPSAEKVQGIARALGVSVDEAMAKAGYISERFKKIPKEFEEIDFQEFDAEDVEEIGEFIMLKLKLRRKWRAERREEDLKPQIAKVYESASDEGHTPSASLREQTEKSGNGAKD